MTNIFNAFVTAGFLSIGVMFVLIMAGIVPSNTPRKTVWTYQAGIVIALTFVVWLVRSVSHG